MKSFDCFAKNQHKKFLKSLWLKHKYLPNLKKFSIKVSSFCAMLLNSKLDGMRWIIDLQIQVPITALEQSLQAYRMKKGDLKMGGQER